MATVLAGFGFYAYLLTNILWLQYVWDYSVLRAGLALVPGALIAAVVAARLGPLADRYGYRYFVVPGALVWAGAYLWYHQRVGLEPAFWSEWMPGQVLSGIGVGATLPLLGSAALAAVPGGRYATASAVVSSARQLGGVLGIAVLVMLLGEPTPGDSGGGLPRRLDALHRRVRGGGRRRPAARQAPRNLGRRGRGRGRAGKGRPSRSTRHRGAPTPAAPADSTDLTGVPMLAGLPPDARRRLEDAAELVVVPAGTWLIREGDPPVRRTSCGAGG